MELDLEKLFNRDNHDVLVVCIERQIEDISVLMLIRRYLEAGTMSGGLVSRRKKGAPQGDPLSPLRRTSCSTNSTANWSGGAIASCVMPMIRTFMCIAVALASD